MDYPLKLDNAPSVRDVFTPVNISILSSVGLHAFLLGLALPNLHWSSGTEKESPIRETVGVIELTPAEQSRLPNPSLSSPAAALLPGLAPTPTTSAPAAPPSLSSPSNLPKGNYSPLPPLTSTLPALPSLPPYPNLPPLQSYGTLRNFPIVNPPLASLPPLQPSRATTPRLPGATANFATPPRGLVEEIQPGLRPQFSPLPPLRGTNFITRAPASDPNAPPPSPQLEDYGIDTPLAMARDNDLTWQAKRGTTIKERIAIAGAYPPIACRNRTTATVVYNADGEGNVDLISASRYPIFNQLAQQAIAGRSFSEPTQISVVFNYDPRVCGGGETYTAPAPSIPAPELARPGVVAPQTPVPPPPVTAPAPAPPVQIPELARPTPVPVNPPSQSSPPTPVPSAPAPAPASPEPQAVPSAPEPRVVNTPSNTPPAPEVEPQRLPAVPESKQDQLRRQQQRRLPLAPPASPAPAEPPQPN